MEHADCAGQGPGARQDIGCDALTPAKEQTARPGHTGGPDHISTSLVEEVFPHGLFGQSQDKASSPSRAPQPAKNESGVKMPAA